MVLSTYEWSRILFSRRISNRKSFIKSPFLVFGSKKFFLKNFQKISKVKYTTKNTPSVFKKFVCVQVSSSKVLVILNIILKIQLKHKSTYDFILIFINKNIKVLKLFHITNNFLLNKI